MIIFKCFSSLPWLFLTTIKAAKSANIEDDCIRDAYIKSIYAECTYIKGTCIRCVCIRDTYLRDINIKIICIRNVYTSNTSIKNICARNTFLVIGAYIKNTNSESTYNLAYKASKSFIKGSRLLVKSLLKMSVSFYLCL